MEGCFLQLRCTVHVSWHPEPSGESRRCAEDYHVELSPEDRHQLAFR
jgi:hypothetical protein